jgi:DNA-binding XRE family transcriptional regulator
MSVQVISQKGKPEYAVLPYSDYLLLVEQAEMLEDIQSYDVVKNSIANGNEEFIPASVVNALADGENPIRVWREYRELTQQQVAEAIGISVPFVSQLETAKRKASIDVMRKLASLLKLDIDDLV